MNYWDYIKIAFPRYVTPYLTGLVQIPTEEEEFTKNWVGDLIQEKDFTFYGNDVLFLDKRFGSGKICEKAVGRHIKYDYVEWSIKKQFEKDISDLANLGITGGVKGAQFGHFPLVPVDPKYPEVICIRKPQVGIYVCGVATIPMMKHFGSELLAGENVQGKKVGFWGFKYLHKFNTKEELKQIFNNKEITSFSNFNEILDLEEEIIDLGDF